MLVGSDVAPKSDTPYFDMLYPRQGGLEYKAPDTLPGHQGRTIASPDGRVLLPNSATYFDRQAGGLQEAQERMNEKVSAQYGGDCVVLTTGGTGANDIAMKSQFSPGDILVSGNDHLSITGAMVDVQGAMPCRMRLNVTRGPLKAILPNTAEDVAEALEKYPDAKGVAITGMTFGGVQTDFRSIKNSIKDYRKKNSIARKIPLHGDFCWMPANPLAEVNGSRYNPLAEGARSFSLSLHKNTDNALGQTSIVGVKKKYGMKFRAFEKAKRSTSQSSLLLSSADIATARTTKDRQTHWIQSIADSVNALYEEISKLPGVVFLRDLPEIREHNFSVDPTKLSFGFLGMTGKQLLGALKENNWDTTLTDGDFVTFHYTKPLTTEEIYQRAQAARRALEGRRFPDQHSIDTASRVSLEKYYPEVEQAVTPYEIMHGDFDFKEMHYAEADGLYCVNPVSIYPPGIATVNIGQRYNRKVIDAIAAADSNPEFYLKGFLSNKNKTVMVAVPQGLSLLA